MELDLTEHEQQQQQHMRVSRHRRCDCTLESVSSALCTSTMH